jgi:hypothetical protein
MTMKKFIILKAETYEEEGEEKFRFAASVNDDDDFSNIIFFFDDYKFYQKDGDLLAQSRVHFAEQIDGKLIPIEGDDSRYDSLKDISAKIIEQATDICIQEYEKTADKVESLLKKPRRKKSAK